MQPALSHEEEESEGGSETGDGARGP